MTAIDRILGTRRQPIMRIALVWSDLAFALAWPVRVWRARQLMARLGALSDHELADIGLCRQDLRDATALPQDDDPSRLFRRRAEQRRRGS